MTVTNSDMPENLPGLGRARILLREARQAGKISPDQLGSITQLMSMAILSLPSSVGAQELSASATTTIHGILGTSEEELSELGRKWHEHRASEILQTALSQKMLRYEDIEKILIELRLISGSPVADFDHELSSFVEVISKKFGYESRDVADAIVAANDLHRMDASVFKKLVPDLPVTKEDSESSSGFSFLPDEAA